MHEIVRSLQLVDEHGHLTMIDSLALVELVFELERATQLSIPTSSLSMDRFASIESIAAFLNECCAA